MHGRSTAGWAEPAKPNTLPHNLARHYLKEEMPCDIVVRTLPEARALEKTEHISKARRRKRERGIWQRRYWEHQLRTDTDLARHVDYIHINPVKHGYVNAPVEWPYTSLHRYIRRGLLSSDRAASMDLNFSGCGERK
jgi:hypothetical protein